MLSVIAVEIGFNDWMLLAGGIRDPGIVVFSVRSPHGFLVTDVAVQIRAMSLSQSLLENIMLYDRSNVLLDELPGIGRVF